MKILIADDDVVSRRRLEGTVARLGHEVVAVADGSAAVAALMPADGPRIAILDWMMPVQDGLDVCRTIRRRDGPYVYVILLTAKDRREDMIDGFGAGADDFLTKPFDATELRARLRSGERVIELQEGLLQAQEALRVQATHDSLTGLWNRGMILDQLDRELNRAARDRASLAIVMADLDHFKRINDTHGHATGDAILRETAGRMRAALRSYDFIGRYGGEEFLLVLPGLDGKDASRVAERLRSRIEAEPVIAESAVVPITVSLGLVCRCAVEADAANLVRAADEALYRAKALGRNRVEVAD